VRLPLRMTRSPGAYRLPRVAGPNGLTSEAIACPACGRREHVAGVRRGDTVAVACRACGGTCERDLEICPRCDRRTVSDRREPRIERTRGGRLAVVAHRMIKECFVCGYRRG
jgi:hypothetical protein